MTWRWRQLARSGSVTFRSAEPNNADATQPLRVARLSPANRREFDGQIMLQRERNASTKLYLEGASLQIVSEPVQEAFRLVEAEMATATEEQDKFLKPFFPVTLQERYASLEALFIALRADRMPEGAPRDQPIPIRRALAISWMEIGLDGAKRERRVRLTWDAEWPPQTG